MNSIKKHLFLIIIPLCCFHSKSQTLLLKYKPYKLNLTFGYDVDYCFTNKKELEKKTPKHTFRNTIQVLDNFSFGIVKRDSLLAPDFSICLSQQINAIVYSINMYEFDPLTLQYHYLGRYTWLLQSKYVNLFFVQYKSLFNNKSQRDYLYLSFGGGLSFYRGYSKDFLYDSYDTLNTEKYPKLRYYFSDEEKKIRKDGNFNPNKSEFIANSNLFLLIGLNYRYKNGFLHAQLLRQLKYDNALFGRKKIYFTQFKVGLQYMLNY